MVQTRSQNPRSMDDRYVQLERVETLEALRDSVDELRENVIGMTTQLQNVVRRIDESALVAQNFRNELRHGGGNNGHGGRNGYHRPTQFTKMEFPRYSGSDILTWVLKSERYFELDQTPEDLKVKIASMHLDEDTFQWHIALEKRWQHRPPSWAEYAELLKRTFGPPFETPMGDFTHLRQRGTISDFNKEFDRVSAKLELSEAYLVDAYVSALKPEIEGLVRMFDPRSLIEARRLARMQELVFLKQGVKNASERGSKMVTRTAAAASNVSLSVSSFDRNIRELTSEDLQTTSRHNTVLTAQEQTKIPNFPSSAVPSSVSKSSPSSPSLSLFFVSPVLVSFQPEQYNSFLKKNDRDAWHTMDCFEPEVVARKFEKSATSQLYGMFSKWQKSVGIDEHMGFVFPNASPESLRHRAISIGPIHVFGYWVSLVHYFPTRIQIQLWYKGKLLKMLQGSGLVQASVYLIPNAWGQLFYLDG